MPPARRPPRIMVGCLRFGGKSKACGYCYKRVPGAAVGWVAVDVGVAAPLHSILGLGQSSALVRCGGGPSLRRFWVGEVPCEFQPGGRLAGRRGFFGRLHWPGPPPRGDFV